MSRLTRLARALGSPFELALERRIAAARSDGDLGTAKPPNPRVSIPFPVTVADYLRAAAGAPVWSTRLARIEALWAELDERLGTELGTYRAAIPDGGSSLAAAWQRHLATVDLEPLNELIAKHNAYYAIEARLRMQWPSGRYVLPEGVQYPIPPVTIDSLLAHYPASST